jgi:hypothetical protein
VALIARIACILLLGVLGACATSDSTQVSSADSDAYNEAIDEINRTWEELRLTANSCNFTDGACFEDALASSGFEQAVADLQTSAQSMAGSVESGECRSSLADLDAELDDLLDALHALRDDARAGDASGIESSAPAVRTAWDEAVTAQGSTGACFSGGLVTTTDR